MNKYHYKLEANKISNYDNAVKHNGEYYYKSPSPYYGPYNTYQRIPQVEEDVKFNTPVTIGETDDFKSPDDLKREMEDDLRQLSKLMLFSSLPKHNPQVSKFSVKHNEPLAYYDPTVKDKEERIDQLRRRILELRKMLNIPSNDVHLYVEVNNSTYPKHPYDMLNHLQESSYSYHHANIKDDLEGLNIFSKDNDKENKKNEEKPTDNKQITQIVHEPNEKSNTEGEIDSSYMDTNISQKAK